MDGHADLEQYLRLARVLDVGEMPTQTASKPRRFLLDGGVAVIAKMADEAPNGWVQSVRHEAAGWVTAKELGWSHLVATTVVREHQSFLGDEPVEASVQIAWPGFEWLLPIDRFKNEEVWQAAIFDVLILQVDRGNNNWGSVASAQGQPRLKLVDHAYTFGLAGAQVGSSFVDACRGQEIPHELRDDVARFAGRIRATELVDLLDANALAACEQRAQHLVHTGLLDVA